MSCPAGTFPPRMSVGKLRPLLPGIWEQSASRLGEPLRLRLLGRVREIDSQNHPSAAIEVHRSQTCGFRLSGASLWSCNALPQGPGFD